MPDIMFTPQFEEEEQTFNANFQPTLRSFDAQFASFITLYRGVERVWIGDGSQSGSLRGDTGVLYAEMEDGAIQRLGPVSAYYYALESGYTGTFQQWVELLLAVGPDAQTAVDAASQALQSKTDAATSAAAAANWATGNTTGTPSATNNAKYYSQLTETRITALGNFLESAVTVYQNSDNGTTHPSETPASNWTSTPNPVKGKYLWSKTTFSWTNGSAPTVEYMVNYIGIDGTDIPVISNAEIDSLFS